MANRQSAASHCPGGVMRVWTVAALVLMVGAPLAASESGSTAHFSSAFPPSTFGDKSLPVMLVHGYDGTFDAENDGTQWDDAISTFKKMGWTGTFRKWAYYGCDDLDDVYAYDMNSFGSHATHYGGTSSHDTAYSCGNPHNRYAPIEHLAYHFAWAVHDKFTSNDKCVVAIGHSMGGLIIRYALAQVGRSHADFPPTLCIKSVVTWGTPHAGSDWGGQGNCITTQRCEMMPGSPFLEWLEENAANPQGTGGTDWTLIGSETDDFVSGWSAISMNAPHRAIYQNGAGVEHGAESDSHETSYMGRASAGQSADVKYWNDWRGSPAPTSSGTWYPITTGSGYWPVMWAAYSLAYGDWGCGGTAYPWPIASDSLIFGESGLTGKNCYFEINSPSLHTDVVTQLFSKPGRDVDMYLTSAGEPESCSATASEQAKLCHLQDVSPGKWILRSVDDGESDSTPFAVRAASFRNQAPIVAEPDCNPVFLVRGRPSTCKLSATDDSPGLSFRVDWGSGTPTRVPASGTAAPGGVLSATHTWNARGSYDVLVTATDDAPKHPLTSSEKSIEVSVVDLPGAPRNVLAKPSGPGAIVISWDKPLDDGGTEIERYEIRATSASGTVIEREIEAGAVKARRLELSDLGADQQWTSVVSAVSQAGEGPGSLPAQARTAAASGSRDSTATNSARSTVSVIPIATGGVEPPSSNTPGLGWLPILAALALVTVYRRPR